MSSVEDSAIQSLSTPPCMCRMRRPKAAIEVLEPKTPIFLQRLRAFKFQLLQPPDHGMIGGFHRGSSDMIAYSISGRSLRLMLCDRRHRRPPCRAGRRRQPRHLQLGRLHGARRRGRLQGGDRRRRRGRGACHQRRDHGQARRLRRQGLRRGLRLLALRRGAEEPRPDRADRPFQGAEPRQPLSRGERAEARSGQHVLRPLYLGHDRPLLPLRPRLARADLVERPSRARPTR